MRPSITQNVIFTYTDDLQTASAFFRDVMELDFVVDQGACHIFRLSDSCFLGVCNLPDRPSAQVGVTITIVSDDVDGWFEFLRGKGIEFERQPAHSAAFGVYSTLFISPHGYRIEIQRFDDEAWSTRSIE